MSEIEPREPIVLRVEAVLAAHQPVPCAHLSHIERHWWWQCSADGCDWHSEATTRRADEQHAAAHRAHVAKMLTPVMAEIGGDQ